MRTVVLLAGPPGAGKTTIARASGMTVYDRDDPCWSSEAEFTEALRQLGATPRVRAVVIRSAASSSARRRAADMIRATHVFLVVAPVAVLEQRIRARRRGDLVGTIMGVRSWFERFDRDDGALPFTSWAAIDAADSSSSLGVVTAL